VYECIHRLSSSDARMAMDSSDHAGQMQIHTQYRLI